MVPSYFANAVVCEPYVPPPEDCVGKSIGKSYGAGFVESEEGLTHYVRP